MPDVSSVHYDVALTNVSIAYQNNAYLCQELAPEIPVRRQSDKYFIYDPERETARHTSDGRAPGTEANEIDFQLSNDSYYCDDHALETPIPDEERQNADTPLRPEIDRVEFLSDKILLNMEINLADKLRDLSLIPGKDLSGFDTWDDGDNSNPISDIEEARAAILSSVQTLPNTLLLPYAVYTKVRNHPKVIERVKYHNGGAIGTSALADLFDVEHVLVARSVKNTATTGQSAVMAPVWGKDALLLSIPKRISLKTMAPVLSFAWSQATGSSRGVSVQTWREERRKATMVRVQKYYDLKIVAPSAAYLFSNAIS
jgi:hypothetical protein